VTRRFFEYNQCNSANRWTDISADELNLIERGGSEIEYWGPVLAAITVQLGVPCRTLICDKGARGSQFQYCHECRTGELIARTRTKKEKSLKEVAEGAQLTVEELTVRTQ
jgi:hypothetical protein